MFVQLAEIVLPKDYEVNEARPETRSAQLKHVCMFLCPTTDFRMIMCILAHLNSTIWDQ